jgi:glycosyltransferase involved in cell wall biosynthesis
MNRPVKVAYVYTWLPVGGAEHHLVNLLAGLDKNRFAPTVVCLGEPGAIGDRLRGEGVPFQSFGLPRKRLWMPWGLRRVAAYFREQRFDIVHTHMYHANTYGRVAAWWAGVPHIVATIHTNTVCPSRKQRIVNRWLDRITDRTIVVSEDIARTLTAQGDIAPARMVVIHNGVDIERYASGSPADATRMRLGIASDARVVCCVGRLEKEKRHNDLLAAFRIVKERVPLAHLLLVGGGRMESAIGDAIELAGLRASVTMTGVRGDVPDLLRASDVFALASEREGLPLALVEAMAAGLPVVVSRVGGMPEAIGGEAGLLFEPGDVDGLAQRLTACLTDANLRQRLGAAARQRAGKSFSTETMVRSLEAVYERSLATTNPGAA